MVSLQGKVDVFFNFQKPCWKANCCCHCTLLLLEFHRYCSLTYEEDTLSRKISWYAESYSLPLFLNCCILYCRCLTLTCNIMNLIVTICEFLGALHLKENEGSLRWVKVTHICGHKEKHSEFFGDYNG